jgi:hypothetical protein
MTDAGAGEKLKVFISYSRKDSAAFADELMAGLELAGFAPFLDRHDIAAGARNPCLRRGPLSLDYWTRLPQQLWRSMRGFVGVN